MKKTTLTKIAVSLSMIGALSLADAQWAVTNVDDVAYFGPTGIFTQMMGQMSNAVKGSVDSVKATQGVQIQQAANNQMDTDVRNRIAAQQAKIAQDDFKQLPTVQQCIDLTRSTMSTGGTQASMGSAGSGAGSKIAGTSADPKVAPTKIVNSASAIAQILTQKQALNTCSATFDASLAGCGGGDGTYVNADTHMLGLKANVGNKKAGMDFGNWTLDAPAYAVAVVNANNVALANAPKYIQPSLLKNDPGYSAMYQSIMQHLWAAQDALIDIANMRKAPAGSLSGAAATLWSKAGTDYTLLFGGNITPPPNPSIFEFINYQVLNDFQGVPATDNLTADQITVERNINERLALSNMIAWKQYQQTETSNILLAHLLAQTTTPVSKSAVDAEQVKAVSLSH